MTRTMTLAGLLVAMLVGQPAHAQLGNLVEVCGDPNASPGDVMNFCQRALNTGQLDDTATAQVQTNLGAAFFDLNRFGEAVTAYTEALNREPQMIAAMLNRARAYEKLRRLNDAAADYAAALALDPQAADAYLGRGAMLLANGDPERAVLDFDSVIAIQPGWVSAYFNRGVALLRIGQHAEAERDFATVLTRQPNDAGAYLNRARARAALARTDAAEDFDKALALKPEWGAGWFARGRYHDASGDREAANSDFLRAYELGHPDPWLVRRVREISG